MLYEDLLDSQAKPMEAEINALRWTKNIANTLKTL